MIIPWDQLNLIRTQVEGLVIEYEYRGEKRRFVKRRECEDLILEWLIDCYLMGLEDTPDIDKMYDTIYRKVAGKTFEQRVSEYATAGDVDGIMLVAETEATRDFNEGGMEGARRRGLTEKTWHTMNDDRVRDTHVYLEGVTVDIDADFYTYDGDHAPVPGLFENAENNCNCRCF